MFSSVGTTAGVQNKGISCAWHSDECVQSHFFSTILTKLHGKKRCSFLDLRKTRKIQCTSAKRGWTSRLFFFPYFCFSLETQQRLRFRGQSSTWFVPEWVIILAAAGLWDSCFLLRLKQKSDRWCEVKETTRNSASSKQKHLAFQKQCWQPRMLL